jgi:hypothetical protein
MEDGDSLRLRPVWSGVRSVAALAARLDRGREYGMGIWKNVRAGAAFMREYQHAAMETLPRWARVVRVGRRAFGMVRDAATAVRELADAA